jgi:hypothetical protein
LRFIERTPTRAEYETLCRAVGWDHLVDFDLAEKRCAFRCSLSWPS